MNYKDTGYAELGNSDAAAREMAIAGYRQTSRRFCHVARVDLTDKELLDFAIIEDLIRISSLKEQYRRCHSEDMVEDVPEEVMELIRKYSEKLESLGR